MCVCGGGKEPAMALDGEVEGPEPITGEGVGAAANHKGAWLILRAPPHE